MGLNLPNKKTGETLKTFPRLLIHRVVALATSVPSTVSMEDPLTELCEWVTSRLPALHASHVRGLQAALDPRVLLVLMSQTLPPLPRAPLLSALRHCGDTAALATLHANACRRAGMRYVCPPQELPALGGSNLSLCLANVIEMRMVLENVDGGCFRVETLSKRVAALLGEHDANKLHDANKRGDSAASSFTAPLLSAAERRVVYEGSLPASSTPTARTRLWLWLLAEEPECIAAAKFHRAHAAAASRRVSEAQRRGGFSQDDALVLAHVLHAPGAGLLLTRRRLVRALVRAGLPAQLRGHLWCRFSGAGDAVLSMSTIYDYGGGVSKAEAADAEARGKAAAGAGAGAGSAAVAAAPWLFAAVSAAELSGRGGGGGGGRGRR